MFGKTFKAIGEWMHASDRKTAAEIEDHNLVDFAENDIEKMTGDLASVHQNIGHCKAQIQMLSDEIKDLNDQVKNNTDKATALIAKGTPEAESLAQQMCTSVEGLQSKVAIQQNAKIQQEKLLAQQQETEGRLQKALQECKIQLDLMKTEKSTSDANKALVKVDSGAAGSAVEKFKERRKKMQMDLYESTAAVEESQDAATSLSDKADKILGTTPGSDLFAKLKAAKQA